LERNETTRVEMASVVVHPEDSNEEAVVVTVGALKDRYGERHLAVGRPRQRKKRIQAMVGRGKSWPPPADEWPAVTSLNGVRDMVVRDQAETMSQGEPLKDGRGHPAGSSGRP
jgi:hypothetical protein